MKSCRVHPSFQRTTLHFSLRVNFSRVKDAIDDIGYHGWLVIESAVGKGKSVQESYVHNQKYLRSVF